MSLTWNDVKSELEKCPNPKSVLLGNGFTIACIDDKNFNQKKIIDKVHKYFKTVSQQEKLQTLKTIFQRLKNSLLNSCIKYYLRKN